MTLLKLFGSGYGLGVVMIGGVNLLLGLGQGAGTIFGSSLWVALLVTVIGAKQIAKGERA